MKTHSILTLFSTILVLSSCSLFGSNGSFSSSEQDVYSPQTNYVPMIATSNKLAVNPFNTSMSLQTYFTKQTDILYPIFEDIIIDLHKQFDRHNNYLDSNKNIITNLKVVNDSYGSGEFISLPNDLYEVLKLSVELTELTDGYFNPTIGGLTDLYSDLLSVFGETKEDPSSSSISSCLSCVVNKDNIRNVIELDDEQKKVRLNTLDGCSERVIISLGAIGKGYAIEKVKNALSQYNYPALIDGGSSSIACLSNNPNPNRNDWRFGIVSPYKENFLSSPTNIAVSSYTGTHCFSTSGDYENYYIKENDDNTKTIRHHILNPFTGYSENYYRVISLSSTSRADVLDALSTALFSIEDTNTISTILTNVQNQYNIKIELLLEQEIAKNTIQMILSDGFKKAIMNDSYNTDIVTSNPTIITYGTETKD